MKNNRWHLLTFSILFSMQFLNAQDRLNIKYGKVSATDFEVHSTLIDSNVNAIVIADIGSSEFEGNNKEWFNLVYKRHKRIKIINSNGFDAAQIEIPLYAEGSEKEQLMTFLQTLTISKTVRLLQLN